MNDPQQELLENLQKQEAGVADLITAYEPIERDCILAEHYYFAALRALAPDERTIASDRSLPVLNASAG